MAGIWNINGAYDINTRKLTGKLSFDVGEVFLAKVLSMDSKNTEILLKLLDGWQLPAQLEKPILNMPQGLVRFQVVGMEDGKLKIVPMSKKDDGGNTNDSLKDVISSLGMEEEPEQYNILEKMAKHNIPLTRENVSRVKTVLDFKEQVSKNPEEADQFIEKYIESKGINSNSEKAQDIRSSLKDFLANVKSMDTDEILAFIENDIEFTGENIKSFNKLFKEPANIYNGIKEIAEKLQESIAQKNSNSDVDGTSENDGKAVTVNKDAAGTSLGKEIKPETENVLNKILQDVKQEKPGQEKETEQLKTEITLDDNKLSTAVNDENKADAPKKAENKSEAAVGKSKEDLIDEKPEQSGKDSETQNTKQKSETTVKKFKADTEEIWPKVKEELSNKTDELKNLIKDVIESKEKIKPEIYNKVFQSLKENMNDIKVFNSLSNQYYYMDLPVKVQDNEYGCRLLIKDDRKKEKKIDSKNIKIAASVNTINMGMINAFIKVSNLNMNVDLKCDEQWIEIIDASKEKLKEELTSMGYNIFINVEKKEEEIDIVGCSDFFNDNSTGAINVKV